MKSIKNLYSEEEFSDKVARYAKIAGRKVMEKVFWLYFAVKRPDCPLWAKSVIIGAIAYFIIPSDAIPDIIFGIGYTDDLGVMLAAIKTVSSLIDENVKKQTEDKLKLIFGQK
ncbi:MAG: YkvA family protein [Deltaproteobacteria bacterium]|nr:YkvA family protein [Deltaproteobacteria bacterium]